MSYLLDTCAILFVAEHTRDLSEATLQRINHALPEEVFISAVSIGELACLQERGKITLKHHWRIWWNALLQQTAWSCLPITAEIMTEAFSLPEPIPRDPSDRMLIATARIMKLTLITTDEKMLAYPHVETLS